MSDADASARLSCPCDFTAEAGEGTALDALEVHQVSCPRRPVPVVTVRTAWVWPGLLSASVTVTVRGGAPR